MWWGGPRTGTAQPGLTQRRLPGLRKPRLENQKQVTPVTQQRPRCFPYLPPLPDCYGLGEFDEYEKRIKYMREMIGRVWFGICLGCATAAASQLPPDMLVDRYLVQVERLFKEKEHEAAREVLYKIVALQEEHKLTLPGEFHFRYAQVALSAGSLNVAKESVEKYLTEVGREGEFYREVLVLLDKVEQLSVSRKEAPTCVGQFKGAECWKELTGQPGCYVWDGYLNVDQTVTWTGECSGGRAQGEGTLKWVWEGGNKTSESTGSLQDGKRHERWVVREADGDVWEGSYLEGKRHGDWVWRTADGSVWEGPFVSGKLQGRWVGRYKDGSVHEGSAADGKRHGNWVERYADGAVEEGSYEEGERHGKWIVRLANGGVGEGLYEKGTIQGKWVVRTTSEDGEEVEKGKGMVSGGKKIGHWNYKTTSIRGQDLYSEEGRYEGGKKHGLWVWRYLTGDGGHYATHRGPYVEGKKHGVWVESTYDSTYEGPYEEGKRHGKWNWRYRSGVTGGGEYVNGKKHGHWVDAAAGSRYTAGDEYYMSAAYKQEGPYVEGKKHGHWVVHWRDGDVDEGPYADDKRHGKWVSRSPIAGKKNRVRVSASIYENGEYVRDGGTWTERIKKKK